MKTTPQSRSALRALEAKATPAKWECAADNDWHGASYSIAADNRSWPAVDVEEGNARFIAAARNALLDLLDDLDEAERELELLRRVEEAARAVTWRASGANLHALVDVLSALDAHRKTKEQR